MSEESQLARIKSVIVFNEVHPEKEALPIVVTESGIIISVKRVHPLNASNAIVVVPSAISTVSTSIDIRVFVPLYISCLAPPYFVRCFRLLLRLFRFLYRFVRLIIYYLYIP